MSRTYYHRHFRKDWKEGPCWRTLMIHRPRRQRARHCSYLVLQGIDVVWPDERKCANR